MRRFLLAAFLALSLWASFPFARLSQRVQTNPVQQAPAAHTADETAAAPILRADGAVNVRDYGARGDGFTDETAAIQAADAAAIAAGCPLVFPAGTYLISSTYVVTGDHRVIRGYGAKIKTATDITAIQLGNDTTGSGVDIIEGLWIENGAWASPKSTSCGVLLYKDTGRTELRRPLYWLYQWAGRLVWPWYPGLWRGVVCLGDSQLLASLQQGRYLWRVQFVRYQRRVHSGWSTRNRSRDFGWQ